jgi:hypothetical protein
LPVKIANKKLPEILPEKMPTKKCQHKIVGKISFVDLGFFMLNKKISTWQ